jgi:hypothetical protein
MTRFFISVLLILSLAGHSQDKAAIKFSCEIDKKEAFKHVSVLASDKFEGRETGHPGAWMAADYIAKQFRKSGVKPAVNKSYLQTVPLFQLSVIDTPIIVNGKKFNFLKDFYYSEGVERFEGNVSEITFCGFGIEEEKYNDYENRDVKGKVIVIMGKGVPAEDLKSWDIFKKIENLQKKQPSLIIVCDTAFDLSITRLTNFIKNPKYYLKGIEGIDSLASVPLANSNGYGAAIQKSNTGKLAPILYLSEKLADELLSKSGNTIMEVVQTITATLKPKSFTTQAEANLNISSKNIAVKADNVVGLIEGTDLKEEVLVISGHYDHLGIQDGKIFNGADDNASGISGMLEIAEAFSKARKKGKGPLRSILFIAFVGEEKGLLGSDYYTRSPLFPLKNTVTNLNIDMIGRNDIYRGNKDSLNYIFAIGSDKLSTELKQINESANNNYTHLVLNYKYDDPKDQNFFYYRSDHFNFAKHGIPVIFYFNGIHKDYHQESDEVSGIKFDLLIKRAKLVFFTAWQIANRDKRPLIDKK